MQRHAVNLFTYDLGSACERNPANSAFMRKCEVLTLRNVAGAIDEMLLFQHSGSIESQIKADLASSTECLVR